MNAAACPQCASTAVTVVDADEARGTVTIRCLDCEQLSVIDGAQFDVDLGDLCQE